MNFNDELDKLRTELVQVSKKVYNRGLTSGISGNISARLSSCPDQILIKATGKCLGDIGKIDFLRVNLDGTVLEGSGKPSVEVVLHCGIYKVRPDIGGVVHGHSPYATAYVAAKGYLPPVTAAAELDIGEIGMIDYAEPGSEKLARLVTEMFRDKKKKAAFLKDHGFITVGQNIFQAYYLADVLEDNAKVALWTDMLKRFS